MFSHPARPPGSRASLPDKLEPPTCQLTTTCQLAPAKFFLILPIVVGLAFVSGSAAAKGAEVGGAAPSFRLPALHGLGVASARLRGRPIAIIVGRSQRSAPHCKKWMVPLVKRFPPGKSQLEVYQVVVIDKSWYVPRSLVLSKLRGFVGQGYRDRFLIEWYTVFADTYGIPRHDDPTVLLIDDRGLLRLRRRMRYSEARWQDLLVRIKRLYGRRPPGSRGARPASRPASRPRPAR